MGGVRTFLAPNLFSQYLQGWRNFKELSAVFLAVQSGKKLEKTKENHVVIAKEVMMKSQW
jgi:hypothetical protein